MSYFMDRLEPLAVEQSRVRRPEVVHGYSKYLALALNEEWPRWEDEMNRQICGLLLAGIVFVAGCGGAGPSPGPGAEDAVGNPVQGDWLVLSYEAEADNLNRIISRNAYTGYIMDGAMGPWLENTCSHTIPRPGDWMFRCWRSPTRRFPRTT